MRQNDERHDDARDTSRPRQPAGEDYGGGTPGMSGVAGNIADSDEIQQTAPAGVPTAPGTGQNPGAVMNPGAAGTPSTPKMSNILGTPGGMGQAHTRGNVEGGTPGVPGTPTPAPIGGQLESRKIPGAAGPTTPSTEQLGLGGTPTPRPADGANHTPRSGDEAATLAREGQAEDSAGAPPPPKTPDPWGGTVSESKANP